MKTILKTMLLAVILLTALSAQAEAAPVLFGRSEKIIKVADFPDTDNFELSRGQYVDAGYVYKQVSVFFIPVWNYDGRWAGYVGKDDTYLQLTKSDLDEMAAAASVKLPDSPSLPIWQSVGGKLVFAFILLLYIGFRFLSGSAGEETSEDAAAPAESPVTSLNLNN
jgi:hypothetical protein